MRLLEPSPGECADRQGILEIKIRVAQERGVAHDHFANEELAIAAYVNATWLAAAGVGVAGAYTALFADLKACNQRLWDLEDEVRAIARLEPAARAADAGRLLARLLDDAAENDERARLVAAINDLFGGAAREKLHEAPSGGVATAVALEAAMARVAATAAPPEIRLLVPSCNLATVRDGRGGIFTWLPEDPLVEFNMLYFQPGKTRGNHYHPEFNEYFLVVNGSGVMVYKSAADAPERNIHMSKGMCTRTPKGVAHAFYAITEVTAVAMLSKRWDDCHPPILHMDVGV
jgi:mannose-6-phosphate isomerase-like protein (cupin superfamily)